MLNSISLLGRLVRDPEKRVAGANNDSVTRFTLAVDRDYSKGGEKQTDFIDCVAWKQTADYIARFFGKGELLLINGSLRINEWTDKNGSKHRDAQVYANNAYSLGKKSFKEDAELKQLDGDDGDLPF